MAIWIVAQTFRTPAYQVTIEQHFAAVRCQVEHYVQHLCRQAGCGNSTFHLGDRSEYSMVMKNHMVETLRSASGVVRALLDHGTFCLLRNNTGLGFCTSDNPVWITSEGFAEHGVVRLRHGDPFGCIVLPLSPTVALVVTDTRLLPQLEHRAFRLFCIDDEARGREMFNGGTVANAHRAVLLPSSRVEAEVESVRATLHDLSQNGLER